MSLERGPSVHVHCPGCNRTVAVNKNREARIHSMGRGLPICQMSKQRIEPGRYDTRPAPS